MSVFAIYSFVMPFRVCFALKLRPVVIIVLGGMS